MSTEIQNKIKTVEAIISDLDNAREAYQRMSARIERNYSKAMSLDEKQRMYEVSFQYEMVSGQLNCVLQKIKHEIDDVAVLNYLSNRARSKDEASETNPSDSLSLAEGAIAAILSVILDKYL